MGNYADEQIKSIESLKNEVITMLEIELKVVNEAGIRANDGRSGLTQNESIALGRLQTIKDIIDNVKDIFKNY